MTLTFSTAQYMNLENIGGQAIIPQSIWSSISDPATYADPTPIGSGPYTLGNYTNEGFTMAARTDYWGGSVPVPKVYFPVYSTNATAQSALFAGQIDWTGNYVPNLQKDFIQKDPTHNYAFEGSDSSNALYPNLSKFPTNQLPVRKAIDVALDRTAIGTQGESGLEAPVLNASGLTQPAFTAWLAPSLANNNLSATGDPAQAASILTAAGYKRDSAGFFAKGGKEVDVSITTPGAYSDYANDVELAVAELNKAGIKATFDNTTPAAYDADAASGSFSLLLRWGSGGISPFNLYNGWLSPSLIGTGNGNYEKLNDPTMTADLNKLNGDQTIAEQTADLAPIESYVATQLPVIPTTTSAEWCEYTSSHYTGWPTQVEPVRLVPAVGYQQRSRLRHRRVRPAAPQAGLVTQPETQPAPHKRGTPLHNAKARPLPYGRAFRCSGRCTPATRTTAAQCQRAPEVKGTPQKRKSALTKYLPRGQSKISPERTVEVDY